MRESNADRNLVLQLGEDAPVGDACENLSAALRFQPQIVAVIAVLGGISRSPVVFALLAALLAIGAIAPRLNPFDVLYRKTLGAREGALQLGPARAPRRVAQAIAAGFNLAIAIALWTQHDVTASLLWVFLLLATASVAVGRLCLGSFFYYVARGRLDYALRTLPWK